MCNLLFSLSHMGVILETGLEPTSDLDTWAALEVSSVLDEAALYSQELISIQKSVSWWKSDMLGTFTT